MGGTVQPPSKQQRSLPRKSLDAEPPGKRERTVEDDDDVQASLVKRVKRLEEITNDLESKKKISELENKLGEKEDKIKGLEKELKECQKALRICELKCELADEERDSLESTRRLFHEATGQFNYLLDTIESHKVIEEMSKYDIMPSRARVDKAKETTKKT